jgi:thiamine transport system ATP-binding protein
MIQLVDTLRRTRGMTVLLTMHTPEDIMHMADTVVFVADGQVIAHGLPSAVLDPQTDERVAVYLTGSPNGGWSG